MKRKPPKHNMTRNILSLAGIIMAAFGFIAGVTLIVIDAQTPFENPYTGIFTYMVVPMVLIGGLLLILIGALLERRKIRKGLTEQPRFPVVDLNDKRHFRNFIVISVVTLCFVCLSVVGGYRAYHFSESVEFCGKTCHEVMKPEYTAYQSSPHAHVKCAECHIGPGADFFVKSKITGLYQVYSVMFDKYHRPIETPVHNLRPAKETCYECHWPDKFFGAQELKRTYFRNDEENSPWTIQMLLKVGGGNPSSGHGQGIHWHVSGGNTVEYIATDEKRLEIPWVRLTDSEGKQTVFQTMDKGKQLTAEQVASAEIRTMDCIDCHNRPTHQYHSPERALDAALASGALNPAMPGIKQNGIDALTGDYKTEGEALQAIDELLTKTYPEGGTDLLQAIATIQGIYQQNMFPEMNVSWQEYPDHIGHMITPGCFRCHNGEHESDQGTVISRDCNSCHTIIAQGPGRDVESINTGGLEFVHPEDIDEEWKTSRCDDCHAGVPVM